MTYYERTSHCWLCDELGVLYFTASITPPLSSRSYGPGDGMQWIQVGEGFHSVAAGYDGLVCGIKDSSLYLRKGVTDSKPMGTQWARHICNIIQVLVGKKCIVRKSSLGMLFSTTLTAVSFDSGVLDWSSVESLMEPQGADCSCDPPLYHYTIDGCDRLYGLTVSGGVACYNLLEQEPCWSSVAEAPSPRVSTRTGWLVDWLSSIWQSQRVSDTSSGADGCCIRQVSVGIGSVWCLVKGQYEVWQLVISQLEHTTKFNWVKSVLPLEKDVEVLHFEASKSSVDQLFFVLRESGIYKMMSFSFNSESSGRSEVMYPSSRSCKSLAISCTGKIKPNFCCEDGKCRFCDEDIFWPRKRSHGEQSSALETKKARLDYRSDCLISGVQIGINRSFLSQQVSAHLYRC